MSRILLISLLILSYSGMAQTIPEKGPNKTADGYKEGKWVYWFDEDFNETGSADSVAFYQIIHFKKGVPEGEVILYYRSGIKRWQGHLISEDPEIVEGICLTYYENGSTESKINYIEGKEHGEVLFFYPDSSLRVRGYYENGDRHGEFTGYHQNGIISNQLTYKYGLKEGKDISYYDNGSVNTLRHFTNGQENGKREEFYKNGAPRSVGYYKDDVENGQEIWYHENGTIVKKFNYVKGLKEGMQYSYYENGQLEWSVNYSDDEPDGKYETFHKNGNKKITGQFENGEKTGEWYEYKEDGELWGTSQYQDGIKEYTSVPGETEDTYEEETYYDNGSILSRTQYKDGVRNGFSSEYYEDGQVKERFHYRDGIKDGIYESFYPDGAKEVTGFFEEDEESGEWTLYFEDGNIKYQFHFKEGYKNGPYVYYYENGQMEQKGSYKNDEEDGKVETFYPDGKPNTIGFFKNGNRDSQWTWHYENGKIKSVGHYENDLLNGESLSYDEDGILSSMSFYRDGKKHGREESYYPDGSVELFGFNREGRVAGESAWYNIDGTIKTRVPALFPSEEEEIWEQLNDPIKGLTHSGRYREALNKATEALNYAEKYLTKNHSYYNISLNNLALVYQSAGDHDKALSSFLEAFENAGKIFKKNHFDYGKSLAGLAQQYHAMGLYEKALPLYIEAVNIFKNPEAESNPDYVTLLNNLADLYRRTGQYEESAKLFLEALEILKEQKETAGTVYRSTLNNLSVLYQYAGFPDKALPLYQEALEITEKINGKDHPDHGTALNNMASIKLITGDTSEALMLGKRALENTEKTLGINHPRYGLFLKNLAIMNEIAGNENEAASLFKLSFQNLISQINSVFTVMTEKEKEAFINYSANLDLEKSFYFNQATDQPEAIQSFYNIEMTTKSLVLNSSLDLNNRIQNINDEELKDWFHAFQSLKKTIADEYNKPVPDRRPDLNQMESEAEQLESKINRKTNLLTNIQTIGNITWQDVRNKLGDNEVAIEFSAFRFFEKEKRTDTIRYAALLLQKSNPHPIIIPLFTQEELDKIIHSSADGKSNVNQLYRGSEGRTAGKQNLNKLYNLIWKPLENYLKEGQTIYFAPAGTLHQIAFSAIQIPDGKYLSDKYFLRQLTTTSKISHLPEQKRIDNIALFGGINYEDSSPDEGKNTDETSGSFISRPLPEDIDRGGTSWSYLPGTLQEISNIRDVATQHNIGIKYFSDKNASEENFKLLGGLNAPAILHISTHGFFFPDPVLKTNENQLFAANTQTEVFKQSDNPLNRSGLLFSGANKTWKGEQHLSSREDGILTAYEASQTYLPQTSLVILSACETGLGDIKGSEGVYGLQRSFKSAGAEYLMMSLWKVPDKETAEFMETFYKKSFSSKDIEKSYRDAQNFMKKKYPANPYSWAAFVLVR